MEKLFYLTPKLTTNFVAELNEVIMSLDPKIKNTNLTSRLYMITIQAFIFYSNKDSLNKFKIILGSFTGL
ncbi:MAG: hypothetical protein K8R58_03875 [Bacteroidales bacterium]|nr:hypothetical protein [Bacteroidales bacterium]